MYIFCYWPSSHQTPLPAVHDQGAISDEVDFDNKFDDNHTALYYYDYEALWNVSNNQMNQSLDLPKILDMSIKYGKYAKYPKLNMSTASNE